MRSAMRWTVVFLLTWSAPATRPPSVRGETSACAGLLNAQETSLARLFETAPRQRRRRPRCHPILTAVARARAADMAARRYFSHVNRNGEGANRLVTRAGYRLPTGYDTGKRANNIEVIAAGQETPAEAWKAWVDSRHHRTQVLGLTRFFEAQEDYGVGFVAVPGSRFGYYWVLISARE